MPPRLIRHILLAAVVVGLSLLGLQVSQHGSVNVPQGQLTPPGFVPVVRVDDGDTIQVRLAGRLETVRFIGMDTPETHDPRKPVQCFGTNAAAETTRLLAGKNVRLEGDPESSDRDKYHRLLRYVYLSDGTFVNRHLVEQGYAFAYVVFANTKLEQFKALEQQAQELHLGLWKSCQIHSDGVIKQTQGVGPQPSR